MEDYMKIEGSRVLISGANRGLGKAFADAFLAAGACKVYAGARDPHTIDDARVIPVRLDVTSEQDIRAAALQCADIDILVNNAGAMRMQGLLEPSTFEL